jgi:hypothetical protein
LQIRLRAFLIILSITTSCFRADAAAKFACSKFYYDGTHAFANFLLENPSNAKETQKKIVNGQRLRIEIETELFEMQQSLQKKWKTKLGSRKSEMEAIEKNLKERINSGLTEGLTHAEYLDLASDFVVVMDIKLGYKTIRTPRPDGSVFFGITRIQDPLEYYRERRESLSSVLKYFNEVLFRVGGLKNIPLETYVLSWPSFRNLDIEDMVRSAGVQWFGLTSKIIFVDGRQMPPSDFFEHDILHSMFILEGIIKSVGYTQDTSQLKVDSEELLRFIEDVKSTAFTLSKKVNEIKDPVKRRIVAILLFNYYHEFWIPLHPSEISKATLALNWKPNSDGLFSYDHSGTNYAHIIPIYEAFRRRMASGDFGDEFKVLALRPHHQEEWLEAMKWLSRSLQEL